MMHFIPLTDIHIPDHRQRREFDAARQQELSDDIEKNSLLHPIVVRVEEGKHFLVAGERRLRSIRDIYELGGSFRFNGQTVPTGCVPANNLGELDELGRREAEFSENVIRDDLTWQEKAHALVELNKLRSMQNPAHTVADLAEEVTGKRVDRYREDTRRTLIVAGHLSNPEIAKAKDVKEAYKLLKRQEEANDYAAKAVEVGLTFGAHLHQALHGDCRDWLNQLPEGSFDIICTDPPYGMGADEFGDGAGKLTGIDHSYDDSEESFRLLMSVVAPLFGRVAKPAAALYICCDLDQFFFLRNLFRSNGWYVFRTPLINVKQGSGRVPLPDYGPRRQYETILFAYRGGKRTINLQSDVIISVAEESLGHGAQKPIGLFTNLLARHCRPGDSVLDPFAGTGTIFPAAHGLKCVATGIELEPAYYGMCIKRIEGL